MDVFEGGMNGTGTNGMVNVEWKNCLVTVWILKCNLYFKCMASILEVTLHRTKKCLVDDFDDPARDPPGSTLL